MPYFKMFTFLLSKTSYQKHQTKGKQKREMGKKNLLISLKKKQKQKQKQLSTACKE